MIRRSAERPLPLLGVCLGHQAIGVAWGGVVEHAPELLHGKTSLVHHDGTGVLAGLPNPFVATRYHSLSIRPDTLPAELEVTGRTDTGVIMAVRHRELPIDGVQFHPESVLTEGGHRLLANWMAAAGHAPAEPVVRELTAETAASAPAPDLLTTHRTSGMPTPDGTAAAARRWWPGRRATVEASSPGSRPGRITRGTPMPKSRVRKKVAYTPPANERRVGKPVKVAGPTHPVYVAVMLGLMLAGLAWLVVNYLAGDVDPVHGRARLVELPDRLLAHRDRPADDHAVALNSGNTRL